MTFILGLNAYHADAAACLVKDGELVAAVEETGVTTDWVLRLDADYMLEPALRNELAPLKPDADIAAYEIAFTYCIEGRPLRGSLYPALPVLFRRGRASFVQDGHTEKLQIRQVLVIV